MCPAVLTKISCVQEGVFTATKYMMIQYNVRRDALDKAIVVTPGKRSPTITNLDDKVSAPARNLEPQALKVVATASLSSAGGCVWRSSTVAVGHGECFR